MGFWIRRRRRQRSSVAGAVSGLLFGIFHHIPIGMLLLGTGLVMPIRNERLAFSLSTGSLILQQQHSVSKSRSTRLACACSHNTEGDDEEQKQTFVESGYDVFSPANNNENNSNNNRRKFLRDQFVGSVTGTAVTTTLASSSAAALAWGSNPRPASAKNTKSRTDGYAVQHTEREWSYILSGPQYFILRKGGTERQKSSILHTFTATDNVGTYVCAACKTPLFESGAKFNSGTGWPSFATALEGVETERMDPISATLGGREVRCATCGGHLGDLFNDGWVYVGTRAFETGSRYCIDGGALIFQPADGGDEIFGDLPPPNKVINYEPAVFRDKSVNSRS